MRRKRDLIITNLLAAAILVAALLAGWRDAALFGLAVLAIMDLLVLIGERFPRGRRPSEETPEGTEEHNHDQDSESGKQAEHSEWDEKR